MRRFLPLVLCLILLVGSAMAEPVRVDVAFPSTETSQPIVQSVTLDDHWFDVQHLQSSVDPAVGLHDGLCVPRWACSAGGERPLSHRLFQSRRL